MGNNVHDIVKSERKKRGIPPMYWSRETASLAQSQANYCAKVGRMVHSNRYAFQGGENLCGGKGNFSPRQVVNSWLGSPKHRAYILSPRVTKSGVGIAKRNGKMFVAWAFNDKPPTYPDCPYYKPTKKPSKVKIAGKHRRRFNIRGKLVRTILGIIASLLIPFLPAITSSPNDISVFFPLIIGFVAMPIGIIGAIVSYWKRRAGAGLMILAFIPALIIAFGSGGWAWIPPLLLGFCIFSSYWHILPD